MDLQKVAGQHNTLLINMQPWVDDLNNQGHCRNLRVRGLSETTESYQLPQVVQKLLNELLGKPTETPVEMERVHRVSRPRGLDSDLTRDIICCFRNYSLGEEKS